MRPTWDQYFMMFAKIATTRSSCLRRKVGAVLVRDYQILATGYNGPPRGAPHCKVCRRAELNIPSGMQQEVCWAVHAEQNVIIQAARHGVRIEGSKLYTTLKPCIICAKMIANAGIQEVVCTEWYPDEMTEQLFTTTGVTLTYLEREEDDGTN